MARGVNTKANGIDFRANRFDEFLKLIPQNLTDAEKAQVMANLGITPTPGSLDGAVRYDAAQTLTDEQKQQAQENAGVAEELAGKANNDGYYSKMTVGAAESLVGGNETSREFTRDTAGGTADIADGIVKIKKIKGNTIVWNQICTERKKYAFQGAARDKFTYTYSDGVVTCTATENIINLSSTDGFTSVGSNLIIGHKYITFFKIKPSNSTECTAHLSSGANGKTTLQLTENVWNQIKIYSNVSSLAGSSVIYCMPKSVSIGDTFAVKEYSVIDLTQMFGAGNEPATVAEFEKLFPLDYYDYNEGELLSLNPTGIKTVGFNAYNPTTGKASVIGGKQYQITGA